MTVTGKLKGKRKEDYLNEPCGMEEIKATDLFSDINDCTQKKKGSLIINAYLNQ